jgi:hypothetical protein
MPAETPAPSDALATEPGEPHEAPEATEEPERGYFIGIKVYGDGNFAVCRKPLPAEGDVTEDKNTYQEMPVNTFEQALKAALKFYQANPVSQNEQEQFQAGYAGRQGAMRGEEGYL